jgi:Trypsin-like peptidase domain
MKQLKMVLMLWLAFSVWFAQPVGAENFYSQISRTVIRLEHFEQTIREGSKKVDWKNKSDGTGFFVRSGDDLFVVSVRHVVERPYDLHARVECLNIETGKKERLLLKLPRKEWVFHPVKGDKETYFVDVAAMKIAWPEDKTLMYFRYEPEAGEGKALNQLPFEDPNPPMSVLAFGFPLNIGFELAEQRPLGRAGIISMKTGKKFLKLTFANGKRFAEERCYLVDLEAFPGNSGSPILNHNSIFYNPQLIGILSAANPSLDYAVVEPVSRIRETLDVAREQEKKKTKFWSPIKNQEL